MSGVNWTKPEERDAVRWFRVDGMKIRDIAKSLGRSVKSVREKLREKGALYIEGKGVPPAPSGMPLILAKLALKREIDMARRERDRSQPFKGGPLSW